MYSSSYDMSLNRESPLPAALTPVSVHVFPPSEEISQWFVSGFILTDGADTVAGILLPSPSRRNSVVPSGYLYTHQKLPSSSTIVIVGGVYPSSPLLMEMDEPSENVIVYPFSSSVIESTVMLSCSFEIMVLSDSRSVCTS